MLELLLRPHSLITYGDVQVSNRSETALNLSIKVRPGYTASSLIIISLGPFEFFARVQGPHALHL